MATTRRKRTSSGKSGGSGRVVDFTKAIEPEGGGGVRWPEDDYLVKVLGGKAITSSEKETPGIAVVFTPVEGKKKGKKITERFWLSPKALPRLRNLIEACGKKPPSKASVDKIVAALKGCIVGITLQDEEYDGSVRSRVAYDFLSKEDFEDDSDDEDADDEDVEEDDDDDEDEEDLDSMDRAELKAYIKENELDVKVKKSMDDDAIRAAIVEVEEDEDDDDDGDELEELDLDDL